jgi:putative ABC transport system permease protein
MRWWQRVLRRSRLERELDAELRFHVDSQVREYVARGMTESNARRVVRLELGGLDQLKEDCRDARGTRWVDEVVQDLRFGARLLVKERGVTAIAVIALALAIAANTTVFTIVNAMVLRGLPVSTPDRIVAFTEPGGAPLPVSRRDLEEWHSGVRAFAGVAGFSDGSMTIGDEDRSPEILPGAYISAGAFALLGERPLLGRGFRDDDDRPGAAPVVILGHTVWTSRYAGDPQVVGRTIRINQIPATIIGVMGEGFRFPLIDELWQPLALAPNQQVDRRDARPLHGFARLADGVSLREAQAQIDAVVARESHDDPRLADRRVRVAPFTGSADNPMFLALFGAVGAVLLIACANVASLLLARAVRRSREISVRLSLGATRWRIARQFLVESGLLAAAAGGATLVLSIAAVKLFAYAVSGITFAYWYHERWTLDGRVFAFTAGITLATTFVLGLIPAVHGSRATVYEQFKDHAPTATGRSARRWTTVLLTVELAFTIALLGTAGLMVRSFLAVYRADLIVDASRLLTVSIRMPAQTYPAPAQRIALYRALEERLTALPGRSTAALASTVPFIGAPLARLTLPDRPPAASDPPRNVSLVIIGARYFETLGVALVRGRPFAGDDGTPGRECAIINQRFAALHFPGEDPIGRRITLTSPGLAGRAPVSATIVGVAPTVRQQFMSELDPVVYLPYTVNPPAAAMLMLRGDPDPASLVPLVRAAVRELDPDMPVYRVTPLARWMEQSRWGHRVFGTMFGLFAAIALALSAIGLYAVTAYAVTERTREIGIRTALGARPVQLVWLFLRRALVSVAAGLAIGIAAALASGHLLRAFLVQTSATDPVTLGGVCALLASVAACASAIPARRATRLDPIVELRNE